MKNLVFICHNILGPRNRAQFQRSSYLCDRYKVHIFCLGSIHEEIKGKAKFVKYCPSRNLLDSRIIFPFWVLYHVLLLHKKKKVHLVYTTYENICSISGLLLKCFGFTWVVDIWDDPELPFESVKSRRGLSRIKNFCHFVIFQIVKRTLKWCDLMILALVPDMLNNYKIDPKKVISVTNGVDLDITKPFRTYTANSEFTISYVGFIKEIRGVDTILSSANYLKNCIPNLKVVLIGYADLEDQRWLDLSVREKGLEDIVKFLGELEHDQVLDEIARSDVCLFPFPKVKQLEYIYPIKIFEYMAMGKCVVATNLTGVRRIIQDGENGFLIKPDSPQEMADAIMKVYKDSNLKKKIEKNALMTVQRYSWNNINNKVGQALDSLIKATVTRGEC